MAVDRLEEKLMGTRARFMLGAALSEEVTKPEEMVEQVVSFLCDYEARLSRFNPDSEINALNQDSAETVAISPLLRQAIEAALWAAEFSGGLIDPTLLSRLKESGYQNSLADAERLSLKDLIDQVELRPAKPDPDQRWREISIDGDTVTRPPGLEIEIGGTGKGFAADLVAPLLAGAYNDWVVNLGGDMRLGGRLPRTVEVIDPFGSEVVDSFTVLSGGVATSGIDSRLWQKDGRVYHHLLDPASGQPAFTGLVSVTAFAASALEAEVRAKMALLSGPEASRDILESGGVLVFADGSLERVGRLA